jgi:hypothetical protein
MLHSILWKLCTFLTVRTSLSLCINGLLCIPLTSKLYNYVNVMITGTKNMWSWSMRWRNISLRTCNKTGKLCFCMQYISRGVKFMLFYIQMCVVSCLLANKPPQSCHSACQYHFQQFFCCLCILSSVCETSSLSLSLSLSVFSCFFLKLVAFNLCQH